MPGHVSRDTLVRMTVDDTDDFSKFAGKGLDALLGLQITDIDDDGAVTATLEIDSRHHQPFGIVHGGIYCAIAESVASTSGFVWLSKQGPGQTAVGVNNNTDFLRSVSSGVVTAKSSPIHRGRRQQLWRVEMSDDAGRLLATSQVRLQNIDMPAGA